MAPSNVSSGVLIKEQNCLAPKSSGLCVWDHPMGVGLNMGLQNLCISGYGLLFNFRHQCDLHAKLYKLLLNALPSCNYFLRCIMFPWEACEGCFWSCESSRA